MMFTLKRVAGTIFAVALIATIFGCHSEQSPAMGEADIQFGPGEIHETPASGSESDDNSESASGSEDEKFWALKSVSNNGMSSSTRLQGDGKEHSRDGKVDFIYDDEGRLIKSVLHYMKKSGSIPSDESRVSEHRMNTTMDITWSGNKPAQIKAVITENNSYIGHDGVEQSNSESTKIDAEISYLADGKLSQILEIRERVGRDPKRRLTRYTWNGNVRSSERLSEDDNGTVVINGIAYSGIANEKITLEYGANGLAKKLEKCSGVGTQTEKCGRKEYAYNSDNLLIATKERKPVPRMFTGGETIVGEDVTVVRNDESGRAVEYTTILEKYISGGSRTTEEKESPLIELDDFDLPVSETTGFDKTNTDGERKTSNTVKKYEYVELKNRPIMLPLEELRIFESSLLPSKLFIFDNPGLIYMPLK